MNIEQNGDDVISNDSLASNEVVNKMTIGEYLRSAREEKNLSLKVISQHTKVSVTILENIENNNFDNLPSKAYVIGFVKSYSKTISLDETKCLELLNEAYEGVSDGKTRLTPTLPTRDASQTNPSVESGTNTNKESHSQLLTVAGVFAALVILFAIVIYSTDKGPSEELASEEETIEKETNQTPLVDVRPQELSESTPLTEKAEGSEQPKVSSEAQVTQPIAPTVKKEEVKKTPEKTAEKKEDKKEEKKVTLRPLPVPLYEVSNDKEVYTYLPANISASLIKDKQNVFINAVDGDTWITYKSDEDDIKKFVLSKGRTLLIRGDVIRIFLGNVHVARIFLNNKALKIASRSGVKSLVFPQEKATDFKLPLFLYPTPGKVITSSEYEQSLAN